MILSLVILRQYFEDEADLVQDEKNKIISW